jgi:tetratricopeptide (TPR) repeat protein
MQGKNAEAAAEFREALRLNSRSLVARNNLGLALANTDSKEQAVLNWQAATDPATAHSNLAAILIEKGQYQEARLELDQALSYNRQHSAALKNLELVSQLDGHTPTITIKPPASKRWGRFKNGFRKLWVGPLQDSPGGAGSGASSGQ